MVSSFFCVGLFVWVLQVFFHLLSTYRWTGDDKLFEGVNKHVKVCVHGGLRWISVLSRIYS